MPTQLEEDIYRTLSYFSYFGYPLTAFEIWKWLHQPSSDLEFQNVLDALQNSTWLKQFMGSHDGFFALASEVHGDVYAQVHTRQRRFLNATTKYRKLRWVLRWVTRVPFVRGVALCNSLPYHFTKETSDIDLFVVVDPGRIWTARFLCVLPLILFRQRPGEAKKNPVDISFFVTTNALSVAKLRLSEDDPYMAHWVRTLVPLYGREEVFEYFVRHNAWAKMVLPHSLLALRAVFYRTKRRWKFPALPISESWFEWIQRKKFPHDIADHANEDNRVVISENVLKFHKNDRRADVRDALNERMACVQKNV